VIVTLETGDKMIKIAGYKESHFFEDVNQDVLYVGNSSIINNTDDNHVYRRIVSNHSIYLNFNNSIYSKFFNVEVVNKEVYESLSDKEYSNLDNESKPFKDIEKAETVRVKKTLLQSFGEVSRQNSDNKLADRRASTFIDRQNFVIKDIAFEENIDEKSDYPLEYNIDKVVKADGKISPIKSITIFDNKRTAVDDLLGLRGNALGTSKSAFRENLVIKDEYEKLENSVYSFLDDVDENFLRNIKKKRLIESFNTTFNSVTNEDEVTVSYRYKNVHSNNVMYFNYKEMTINPFREKDLNENEWWIDETSNRYKLSSEEMNEAILTNRSLNNQIKESIIYASRGRDINLSSRSTLESIAFYERLN
jgi:hypothetical protein